MDPHPPLGIDTSHPSTARSYDYLLGGTQNYPVDRQAAEAFLATWPEVRLNARTIREWAIRAVRYLATEAGITQFLDLGSGLPTEKNTHQVAQQVNAEARVMYVDNDPIVLAHGRALLAANDRTGYVEADVRDPELILTEAAKLLDFNQPVAVVCSSVLHWVECDPVDLIASYVRDLVPGSYLAVSYNTGEGVPAELVEHLRGVFQHGWYPKSSGDILAMFQGLELVQPGLTRIEDWWPVEAEPAQLQLPLLGGVARVWPTGRRRLL